MQQYPARPLRARPVLFSLALVSGLLLAGCEPAAIFGEPHLILLPGDSASSPLTVLTAQAIRYDQQHQEFIILHTADAERETWTRSPPLGGQVAGLLPSENGLRAVFRDGAIFRWSAEDRQLTRLRSGGSHRTLASAAEIRGNVYGMTIKDEGLQALLLNGEEWEEASELLPTVGRPLLVRMVEQEGHLMVFWRTEIGGRREPGLKAARLKDREWVRLPMDLPEATRGFYAVAAMPEGILLVREPRVEVGEWRERLLLNRYAKGKWTSLSAGVRLPPDLRRHHGLGLALTTYGTALVLARVDPAGIHTFTADISSAGVWRVTGDAIGQEHGDVWAFMAIVIALTLGLVLIIVSRLAMLRAARLRPDLVTQRIGGLASPMDRALAMMVDIFLILPMPLVFLYSSNSYDLFHVNREEGHLVYWVGLVGLSIYMALGEAIWGRTLGKMLFRLHVRNAAGGRITVGQALLRNAARMIDFYFVVIADIAMPYLFALLSVSFTRRRQRIGDLLARTVVLRHTPLDKRVIVLASASPRRRELLNAMGFQFTTMVPDVDETIDTGQTAEENAQRLAQRKAEAVAKRLKGQELVIAADTLVAKGDEIIGKPVDREDAKRILHKLSGSSHAVVTGVAIVDRAMGQALAATDRTDVDMLPLSGEDIDEYVASGEADGKAGAYAIQETADRFVHSLRGSLSNVIGLPVELLRRMLTELDA